MEELEVPDEVAATRLHPHEEVLRQDANLLLLGRGCSNFTAYDRYLSICGDPTDKEEVDPLQGGDPVVSDSWGQTRMLV